MKKKAIKIAAASAVAASAFVATAPVNTNAASNVKTEVSLAVAQMNKAYHTYSDVTATGKFADITEVYKEYNAAKAAYNKAKDLATKAGGAQKEAYLAQLDTTYNEMIAKRVVTYIDAYKYATVNLEANSTALKAAIEGKKLAEAEVLYHEISKQLKTRTVILDRVYGQTTRDLFRNGLKKEAQTLRDSLVNDVTVSMKLVAADAAVKANKLEEAKTLLDAVKTLLPNLSAAFKAELEAKNTAVATAYEATQTTKVVSVAAVDTNKVEVKFDKAVDPTKVTVALKVGAASLYTTSAFSEDKKTVTLTAPSAIAAGDYNVVVTGIDKTDVVKPLTVAAVAAKEVVVTNTQAFQKDGSVVSFSVKNQYGTDMGILGNNADVVATAYNVTQNTAVNLTKSATKSELALDLASAKVGDDIRLIVTYKGVTQTKTIKVVANASISDITLGAVAPLTGKARITAGETGLTLPYTLKDQYGNDVKLNAANKASVTFVSSDNAVVNPTTFSVDETTGKVTFTAGTAGTATITAIINATGKVATTTVTVSAAAALKTVSISAPTTLVSAGQTVNLDLAGADQFGGAVTDFSGVVVSSDNAAATASIVNGKLQVVTSGTAAGTAVISLKNAAGTVTYGTVTVKFEKAAEATAIVGVDTVTALEVGATDDITLSEIKVKDQYGRDYALKASDVVSISAVDGTMDGVVVTKAADNSKFTATAGAAAGTEVVKFALSNGASFNLSLATVASSSIASYTINPVGTLYAPTTANAAYNVALTLTGKLADGTNVDLANNKVTNATSSNEAVATVSNTGVVTGKTKGTSTITLWNNAVKLAEVTVTVDTATPVATSVAFDETTANTVAVAGTLDLSTKLAVKDQYGVVIANPAGFYASSDSSVATVNQTSGLVTGVKAGKVTITYVTSNGIVKTTTVTVQ